MTTLDFLTTIRDEFADGYLKAFALRGLRSEHHGVTVEFSAQQPFEGHFRLHVPLPQRPHDTLWDLYDDRTDEAAEWTRWGIAVPLEEAYSTQAASGKAGEDGVIDLHMP